jgi:hypothetical protein
MAATAHAAVPQFALVTDGERGQRIQARLDALRISDREFQQTTGIDRKTLRRAVAGETHVRENTYRTIEDWIDRLERQSQGFEGLKAKDPADDLIEFELSGNFGVRVVVKGPIRDQEALEASVARLIREMRGEGK